MDDRSESRWESYSVATPENISFSYDVAGIGSRFIAALIDFVIYILAAIALAILRSEIQRYISDATLMATITAIYIAFSFLFYWGYYILFELIWAGQSPGKRIARIRVVRLDGTPASPGQIVIRNVGRLVDLFPGFYAVGVITMLLNDQARRLGDFAAGTLVVREVAQVSLSQVVNETGDSPVAPGAPMVNERAQAEAATLPVNRLSKEQRQIAREFLARRAEMNESLRARLALQIGASAARQMDFVVPVHPAQAEYLLELIAIALGQKN